MTNLTIRVTDNVNDIKAVVDPRKLIFLEFGEVNNQ